MIGWGGDRKEEGERFRGKATKTNPESIERPNLKTKVRASQNSFIFPWSLGVHTLTSASSESSNA